MRFGFDDILEQHRIDMQGREQLSDEAIRRLQRQVVVIRTYIYARPNGQRHDAERMVPGGLT